MKVRLSFCFSLQFLIITLLSAQPMPCTLPAEMTPFCEEACIICSIDGFQGRHESDVRGVLPDDFCTTFVHNGQWIAFIAGSVDLTIDITVSNCTFNNAGLEIGIYEGIDCQNFRRVSNCNTNARPGQTHRLQTNTPLTIGQYYFIAMDGSGGDNCNWLFTVIEGSTEANPLTTSGVIEGDFTTCPNTTTEYSVESEVGATIFEWTLDGVAIGNNEPNVAIEWERDGNYLLCIMAANACDEAPPTCRRIEVSSIPSQRFSEVICSDQSFMLNDTIALTEEGTYEFNFTSEEGCDSTIFVNLEVIVASSTFVDVDICDGDELVIGNTSYFETGEYVEVLENYIGCDSIVTLDLFVIICEIQGASEEVPTICNGEASGKIDFLVLDGTPPFDYTWKNLENTLSGEGTFASLNTSELIENLPAGTYVVTIKDDFGNDLILIQNVTEPPVLSNEWLVSDYNGFGLSCFDGDNGSLEVLPIGGVAPYSFSWDNGSVISALQNLTAGSYMVTLTDSYGCEIVQENVLTAPSPIEFQAIFTNSSCGGLATGQIEIIGTREGAPPYEYQFSDAGFQSNALQTGLSEGTHSVTVRDANGCMVDTTATLTAPIIPELDLGEDKIIFLAESLVLDANANISLENAVQWSDAAGLDCYDCPSPNAQPFVTTTYTITATSEDGCIGSDSITIGVLERRRVYVPNVFSPNTDGINDLLPIFAGEEASLVKTFRVFSRWGELLYEANDFLPNDPNGWTGEFKGQVAAQGIYVWTTEVEFLDGIIKSYSGDVLLLK